MVTSCGHSFSKSSILQWLASHPTNARCPVCNATLKPDGLAPNWALRSAIAKYFSLLQSPPPRKHELTQLSDCA
jgi:hypothetical protein